MTAEDLPAALALWRSAEGVTLTTTDDETGVLRFLERNPGFSFVAELGGRIVGVVAGGHDGRRGYLHHLAVEKGLRRQGVAARLAEASLEAMREAGLEKVHAFIEADNPAGLGFCLGTDWFERTDLRMVSRVLRERGGPRER